MFSLLIAVHDEIIASTQLTAGIGQSASERMCARAAPRPAGCTSPPRPPPPLRTHSPCLKFQLLQRLERVERTTSWTITAAF